MWPFLLDCCYAWVVRGSMNWPWIRCLLMRLRQSPRCGTLCGWVFCLGSAQRRKTPGSDMNCTGGY